MDALAFPFWVARYATTSRIWRLLKMADMGGMTDTGGVMLAKSARANFLVVPSGNLREMESASSFNNVPTMASPSLGVTVTKP